MAMKDAIATLDISDEPLLVRVTEEMQRDGRPRVLRRNGEDVAILMPQPPRKRARKSLKDWKPSTEDLEAFRSAAGGWKDMDTDTLIANIYADRRATADRPPVDL